MLGATTSTYDSGLLDSLISRFGARHPRVRVRAVVVGSAEALELGRRGDVDVLLVHAPEAEERFMREGHGIHRVPVMYNDFVIAGPPEDPVGVRGTRDAARALAAIAESGAWFVSRGDSSGTHYRELALWRAAGAAPAGERILETGQGQGESLQMASERGAYTLTDRATFHQLRALLRLDILVEGDPRLLNLYSVIPVQRAANPAEAERFADWLGSEEGRAAILAFGRGADPPLFTPLIVGSELPIPAPHDPDSVVEPDTGRDDGGAPRGPPGQPAA